MDVRLPDGRILKNVPEGTTRAQIEAKLGGVSNQVPRSKTLPAPEKSSPLMSAVAGVNRGIASVAGLPVDTALNIADLARAGYGTLTAALGRPDLSPEPINRLAMLGSGENIASGLNRLAIATLPQGDTTGDRYAYAAGMGAPGALMTPQNALAGLLRGTAGGVAGQGAMDASGSPTAAVTASILASGSPELARGATARLARGGDAGRQAMQQNVAAFQEVGAKPSLGQATGRRTWRSIESVLAKVPGSAGVLASKGEGQQAAIGAAVDDMANTLAPRSNATVAGVQITRGVTDDFIPRARQTQSRLYSDFDRQVPPGTAVPVTNTLDALDRIRTGIPNATAISGSRLVRNSLADDLFEAVRADAPYGGLPYEALKAMRTRIGEKLSDLELAPDVSRQQLKQIYAGLSEDMKVAAAIQGPKAQAAFDRANRYTRSMHERIDALERVIDKAGGPEKVFQSAISGTGEGATTLRAVMKSLPDDAKATLTASVLRRLGRASPGQQNDVGDVFSTQTFLTNWAKLSPEAKTVLVGRMGLDFRRQIDSLAKVASNLRQGSKVYANPSGTSDNVAAMTTGAAFGTALMSGNIPVAVGIAGGVTGANLLARGLHNQTFIRALSEATELPPSILLSQITNVDREAQ